jgi:hypothetical protein
VNNDSSKKIIYFQIPPGPRELKVDKHGNNYSFQVKHSFNASTYLEKAYINSKLNFIDIEQLSIEEILELLFLKSYLLMKNCSASRVVAILDRKQKNEILKFRICTWG